MNHFSIIKNFIPYLEIMYDDVVGFPDQKAMSMAMIRDLDIVEDRAESTAHFVMHYRKQDKDLFMKMLNSGVEILLSDDMSEVVKDHMDKYKVVDLNDERSGMLLMMEAFTTNDMFIK